LASFFIRLIERTLLSLRSIIDEKSDYSMIPDGGIERKHIVEVIAAHILAILTIFICGFHSMKPPLALILLEKGLQ